jgi:hypothetical protein
MRIFASVLLILLVVPLFLIGVTAITAKYQLLVPSFWQNTFDKNNVYAGITETVKKSIVEETVRGGGKASEITQITDLVTPLNVRDFINRNLENVLNYTNGKTTDLLVYIPVGRAPKGFLPKDFENLPETMPLNALLTRLNIMGVTQEQIQYISFVGISLNYLLILDAALLVLFLIFLFLLTPSGSRFLGPGIALILSGFATLSTYFSEAKLRVQIIKDFAQSEVTSQSLIGIVVPPVMQEVFRLWLFIGVGALLAGIALTFLRRPGSQVKPSK